MRLFDAIVEANRRALEGDDKAGVRVADFAGQLPVATLTCIDPRLNHLFPGVLGLPEESFIWLRNAGNIVSGPMSSTVRSLALACAIKNAREIAIIGHSDCLVGKTTVLNLIDGFKSLGVDRSRLPQDPVQYFGLFASERQNVIRSVESVRQSPLIGPTIPVHGLMVETDSGRLQWVVNGYEVLERPAQFGAALPVSSPIANAIGQWGERALESPLVKSAESRIGEAAGKIGEWLSTAQQAAGTLATLASSASAPPTAKASAPPAAPAPPRVPPPQKAPVPPPIQPMPRRPR